MQLKYKYCFLKKNREERYDYLVASWKAIQSLIIHISRTRSFKCWIFLSTTYLSCLVDECFNRILVFHWKLIVLHHSPICFKGYSRKKDRKLSQTFNSRYRYIDDVQSVNNSRFGDYLQCIYPNELEVKFTTDTKKSASYLDIHFEIDNGWRLK
jgi:hypothetical protein